MKIDIKDLLDSVRTIQAPGVRFGWPDDPTPVDVTDPQQFSTCLENALQAFRNLQNDHDYLVNAKVNTYHRTVRIRFVQDRPCMERNGLAEPEFEPAFRSLRAIAVKNGGNLHYWGGNNYFDLSLPFRGPMREDFPAVENMPWDERYRHLLDRASWETLREKVFRFSNLAESFASRCIEFQMKRILIPSVGLCVHPWLFADRGMSVIATEMASSALSALAEPSRWPQLYSRLAYDRWDIAQSAIYATQGNPDRFERMPDLQNQGVRERLQSSINFAIVDWTELPFDRASVDAIFATNALPRESADEQSEVLREWGRVIRPGGIVLIAQHNFFNSNIESILQECGWVETNIMSGERPPLPEATGFQIRYSSG